MQKLLEVSRRLTDVAASGEVDRAILRDAVGLAKGEGAALVHRVGDELSVGAETQTGLLVPHLLSEGAIRQVADTGQALVQVSATEPAIRNLPVALAAVPLVGGGRVEAVLVVVRRHTEPFVPAERDLLMALAPVAAAAMQNARQARAAVEESLLDPLTGIGNRRRFELDLAASLTDNTMTALCLVDLDHFKSVNDGHGHPAGDALLKRVSAVMRDTVRPSDSVYRVGGEEFAILLRRSTLAEVADVAERVRAAIAERPFDVGASEPLVATASLGVAAAFNAERADLVGRADVALYEAKQSGRNRVRVHGGQRGAVVGGASP